MRAVYPRQNLGSIVGLLQRRQDSIKTGQLFSRSELLQVLGFSDRSGAGQIAITSLLLYGFLLNTGDKYYFSERTDAVLDSSIMPDVRKDILRAAVMAPPLFRDLYDYYMAKKPLNLSEIAMFYHLEGEQLGKALDVFEKSVRYVDGVVSRPSAVKTANNSQVATVAEPASSTLAAPPVASDSVRVDFGNGFVADVPKRVILEAYLAELQKLRSNFTG